MASRAEQETSQNAQVPPTRQTGAESATGVALATEEHQVPSGDDRGSKTEIEGGDIRPDSESPKPIGAQAELARFSSNGQIPHNHVPTPSGSVPVGATTLSVEDARERVAEVNAEHDDFVMRRGSRKRLSIDTVQRLSPPELRAIADQRGYNLAEGGIRAIRESFMQEQDADGDITDREDKIKAARTPVVKKSARKSTKRRSR